MPVLQSGKKMATKSGFTSGGNPSPVCSVVPGFLINKGNPINSSPSPLNGIIGNKYEMDGAGVCKRANRKTPPCPPPPKTDQLWEAPSTQHLPIPELSKGKSHYYRFCSCAFISLLTFICISVNIYLQPQINTHRTFTIIHGHVHVQSRENFEQLR